MIIAELKLFCEQYAGRLVEGTEIFVLKRPSNYRQYKKTKGHIVGYSKHLKDNFFAVIICGNCYDDSKMNYKHIKLHKNNKFVNGDIYLLENIGFEYYINFDSIKIIDSSKDELANLIKTLEL